MQIFWFATAIVSCKALRIMRKVFFRIVLALSRLLVLSKKNKKQLNS